MANFQDTRFFGMSPRAIGMGIIAVVVVVGLFFIPETVKLLFDARPRTSQERAQPTESSSRRATQVPPDNGRAALAPDALNALNSEIGKAKNTNGSGASGAKIPKKGEQKDDARPEGFFSGWNFRVKAGTSENQNSTIPAGLTFDRISTKEGQAFFRRGRVDIGRFFQREKLPSNDIQDAIAPLTAEIDAITSASNRNLSVEEVGARLRNAHVTALRQMYKAGADRGLLMRWANVGVIKFIDERGGVGATRKMRAAFAPKIVLTDLSIRQRLTRAWGMDGRSPARLQAEISLKGSDVERVVVYANGKQIRVMRFPRNDSNEARTVRVNGDAYGVWSFVSYDKYGARPYTKSYSFYPRVKAFRQGQDGSYNIAFLPGSAKNSLDRFFYAGSSGRMASRDPSISHF